MPCKPIVYIVDDDASVLKSLSRLIRSAGLDVKAFENARAFLTHGRSEGPCCLLLDIRMPGLSGLDLQESLHKAGCQLPIIFMTGFGDISMSVRAMKAGAADFLEKPVDDAVLLETIPRALENDRKYLDSKSKVTVIQQRLATLTPREREVFAMVITGRLNKQVAYELGTSEKTIKIHRGRVMKKMGANSLVDLVHMNETMSHWQTNYQAQKQVEESKN